MRRAAGLLLLLVAASARAWGAQGGMPVMAQAGGDYLGPELRRALETDWGYRLGIATLLAERGLLGMPSLDLDLRYAPDGEGDFIAGEVAYAERRLVQPRWWLGAGLGSHYLRLKLDERPGERAAAEERRWGVGGKLMLGYLVTERAFAEVTGHYTERALGIDTWSVSGCLGYWF